MNIESLILRALPPVEIQLFDDAQFHHEPRMALVQRCYHDLQEQMQTWAAMGMMGAHARQQARPGPTMGAILANAKLPRASLHPHHDVQIKTALTLAQDLCSVVISLGIMHAQDEVPQGGICWSAITDETLRSQLQIVDRKVWLTIAYDPIQDANNPINRIGMVYPPDAAQPVACLFWSMPIPTERAAYRILEAADLAHWALRQPRYVPQ